VSPTLHGTPSPSPSLEEPTALFVNTGARHGLERFEEVRSCLRSLGVPLTFAAALDDPEALVRQVRAAADAGVRRIVVGGGDGTLSAAAGELAGRDVSFGVLPLGTGNDFARSVGIPRDLASACRVITAGSERRVDLGVSDGRAFLNAASIGLSSAITRRLSPNLKRRLGRGAFAVSAATEAINHRPFRAELEIDGVGHTFELHQVVVANGRYHGGGQLVAPSARHDDRRLDVYVIQPSEGRVHDLWTLFRVGVLLVRGRHLEHPAVTHFRARRVRLDADPTQEVDVDGELLGETPVEFGVRPAALRVLVPPP
jgi:diacylglycerol kinase (ATP)